MFHFSLRKKYAKRYLKYFDNVNHKNSCDFSKAHSHIRKFAMTTGIVFESLRFLLPVIRILQLLNIKLLHRHHRLESSLGLLRFRASKQLS